VRTVAALIALLAIALMAATAAALAPSRALNLLGGVIGGFDSRTDVAYGRLPRQRLDIYTRRGPAPAGGWPIVVFFYGGSWNNGARSDYAFVGAALASHGVLTLVADYRPPRWLAPTGHAPGELAGWIGLAGPYDFLPSTNPDVQPVFFHPNYPSGAQPIEHVSAAASGLRAFIAAPSKDTVVNPIRSSQGLAARLGAAGMPVTLKLYDRASHTTLIGAMSAPLRWIAPVHEDVLAFIRAGRSD
jgi:acetyl esterase/lipase